jgi:phosphoribosylamine---glycine ligase
MKVCVVGSGGREHALALALARTAEVVVTPGNPGMDRFSDDPERMGATGTGTITVTDDPPEAVACDLIVIGPEQPLVDGMADRLRGLGRLVFGPGADGAHLEGSKSYMKEMLAKARVPTARWGTFDDLDEATEFLKSLPGPWVVKTDGLAAGKGVLVTDSIEEARTDVAAKLSGASFGSAGQRVVVEEGLTGRECSLLVLCDGKRIAALVPAQDSKRVGDDDTGPNSGGMGAFSPVAAADAKLIDRVLDEAVEPLVGTMRRNGIDYRGVLYAGLMLTEDGPKVLEYNVRFGDPETQVVLPRLDEDLTGLLAEAASGRLRTEPRVAPGAAVCVVMASEGYPGTPRTGDVIEGLAEAYRTPGVTVVHGATALDGEGNVVTAGGRVLGIIGEGADLTQARRSAYAGVEAISWTGMHHRSDIAAEAAMEETS